MHIEIEVFNCVCDGIGGGEGGAEKGGVKNRTGTTKTTVWVNKSHVIVDGKKI